MSTSFNSPSIASSSSSSTTSFDTYDSELIAHYDDPTIRGGEIVPSYEDAMRPQVTTHIFSTMSLAKGTSISLELNSMAADSDSTPLFAEGDTLEGRVLLDLKKSGVKEVSLAVRGRATCIIGSLLRRLQYDLTFLEPSLILWSPARGSSSPPQSLPFRFTLPKTISHSEIQYALPPSAQRIPLSRLSMGSIHYLPGPRDAVNPGRWHEATFTIPGKTSDGCESPLLARILIPHPLRYPVGSTIPFRLFVSVPPSSPTTLYDVQESQWDVFIAQHRLLYLTTSTANQSVVSNPDGTTSAMDIVVHGAMHEVTIDDKPSKNSEAERSVVLSGELCLPQDLTPSFQFPLIDVEYRVHVVPRIPGFQVLDPQQPIEIPIMVAASFPQLNIFQELY
ncbi:hypothetical protein DL93DRAFT_2166908 [Clavulina sp. PMI_390]|nr:hypothetical protein DL93DRAFT_2166908 [Clavulina sp. PMI_390]